jgi:hypothetical protein
VFTADPRLVPGARKLDRVSFEEMLEMASSGAGVMMARSIEIARTHTVRLNVRSSFEDDDGTWITEEDDPMLEKALISAVVHQRQETTVRGRDAGQAVRSPRPGERQRRHDPAGHEARSSSRRRRRIATRLSRARRARGGMGGETTSARCR